MKHWKSITLIGAIVGALGIGAIAATKSIADIAFRHPVEKPRNSYTLYDYIPYRSEVWAHNVDTSQPTQRVKVKVSVKKLAQVASSAKFEIILPPSAELTTDTGNTVEQTRALATNEADVVWNVELDRMAQTGEDDRCWSETGRIFVEVAMQSADSEDSGPTLRDAFPITIHAAQSDDTCQTSIIAAG